MNYHRPPKPIPAPAPAWNLTSETTPPEKVYYDFNQAIETLIKFIDLDLNDKKVAEHIKRDLRVLRAIVSALNANYPFTDDPNNADAMERKFRRENALTNIIKQVVNIGLDVSKGKFDQPRASDQTKT